MPLDPSILLEGLNEAQQNAVMATEGPLLVVAGPGTGKTLTIVRRIAWLVRKGFPPEHILAVTFTNRAAREMKERAEALLGSAAAPIFIGTFHLLGLRILREQGRDFTLLNREEQVEILKTLVKGTGKALQQELERISGYKNFLGEEGAPRSGVYAAYQSALAERNALDFDDLIRLPVELLQDERLRQAYQERFTHVIVDEYQDINPAQDRLLRLLCPGKGNLCAVGDADQAIYSFRGADLRSFLNFERDFLGARRIDLVLNYRSTATIIAAAERVIRRNRNRFARQLAPTGERGGPVVLYSVPDDRGEGAAIIDEIELRMGGMTHETARESSKQEAAFRPYRFSDFAVIYRTNAQARALEDAFAASGIPFQVIGKPSSMQRNEAEETLAFLRTLAGATGGAVQAQVRPGSPEARLLTEADFFDSRADAVALLTMHMAKGLEFAVVFVAGCEDGLVPCTIMKDGIDLEEERRLFYVGMTRAKDQLILLHARKRFLYGQSLGQKTSPFVREIPTELIESRTVADRLQKEKPEDRQMGLF
jgi:DNA helicase-2/ATP-dependent DNA helicase PcrA